MTNARAYKNCRFVIKLVNWLNQNKLDFFFPLSLSFWPFIRQWPIVYLLNNVVYFIFEVFCFIYFHFFFNHIFFFRAVTRVHALEAAMRQNSANCLFMRDSWENSMPHVRLFLSVKRTVYLYWFIFLVLCFSVLQGFLCVWRNPRYKFETRPIAESKKKSMKREKKNVMNYERKKRGEI